MKLTKTKLKQLIKEELENVLNEQDSGDLKLALYHIQSAGTCLEMGEGDDSSNWRGCINVKHLRSAIEIIGKHKEGH